MDRELLMIALSFWFSATNTMVFPFGLIGLTVLDVMVILNTSPSSLPVDTTLWRYQLDLDLKIVFNEDALEVLKKDNQGEISKDEVNKMHKNFFNYNTFINHFANREKEKLKKEEHEAFLFYWYNKFIFYTMSNKCLAENMPVAEALANGRTLAFSPAILANLTPCLAEVTVGKIHTR